MTTDPTHTGPDPSHGGLTTHRGHRDDCTGPDCGPTEQHAGEQPRRILTEDEYETAYLAARRAAPYVSDTMHADALAAALATVGILTPPPEPDPYTCSAMWPDTDGIWQQCAETPHDDNGHDSGDWAWTDDAPNAIPARNDAEGTA